MSGIKKVSLLFLVLFISACSFFSGSEEKSTNRTCSNGGNTVTVRIRNSQPGDSVEGILQCGGIEVARCTATVAAGASEAMCSDTSNQNAQGLQLNCYDTIVAGNPNPAAYFSDCH